MNLLTNSMPGSLPPGVRLDDDQEDEVKMMDMFVSILHFSNILNQKTFLKFLYRTWTTTSSRSAPAISF